MAVGKLEVEVASSNVTIDSEVDSVTSIDLTIELSTDDSNYKMVVTEYEVGTQRLDDVEFSVVEKDLVGKEGSKDSPTEVSTTLNITTKKENSSTSDLREFSAYASIKVLYDLYIITVDPPTKVSGTQDPLVSGNTYSVTQKPAMAEIPDPEDPYEGLTEQQKKEAIEKDTSEAQRKQNKKELMNKAKNAAKGALVAIMTPLIEPLVTQLVGATAIASSVVSQIQMIRAKKEANLKNLDSAKRILSRLTGLAEDQIEEPEVTTNPTEDEIKAEIKASGAAPSIKYSVSKDDPVNPDSDYSGLLESGKLYDLSTKYSSLVKKKEEWEKYQQDLQTSENPDPLVAPDKFSMIDKTAMDKAKSDLKTNLSRVISIDYRFVSLDKIKELYDLISLEVPTNPVEGSIQRIAIEDKEDDIKSLIEEVKYDFTSDATDEEKESKIKKKIVEEAMESDVGMKVQKGVLDISENAQALVTTSPLQLQHGVMAVAEPMAAVVVTPMGPGAVANNALQTVGSLQDLKVSVENAKAPLNNIYTTAAEIGLPPSALSSIEPVETIINSINIPI